VNHNNHHLKQCIYICYYSVTQSSTRKSGLITAFAVRTALNWDSGQCSSLNQRIQGILFLRPQSCAFRIFQGGPKIPKAAHTIPRYSKGRWSLCVATYSIHLPWQHTAFAMLGRLMECQKSKAFHQRVSWRDLSLAFEITLSGLSWMSALVDQIDINWSSSRISKTGWFPTFEARANAAVFTNGSRELGVGLNP
jgi:hypothetical protein